MIVYAIDSEMEMGISRGKYLINQRYSREIISRMRENCIWERSFDELIGDQISQEQMQPRYMRKEYSIVLDFFSQSSTLPKV